MGASYKREAPEGVSESNSHIQEKSALFWEKGKLHARSGCMNEAILGAVVEGHLWRTTTTSQVYFAYTMYQ